MGCLLSARLGRAVGRHPLSFYPHFQQKILQTASVDSVLLCGQAHERLAEDAPRKRVALRSKRRSKLRLRKAAASRRTPQRIVPAQNYGKARKKSTAPRARLL